MTAFNINNLDIYLLSIRLANEIWFKVNAWNYFSKETIGKQLVRASDSIPANISEGYGRFHFKEEKQFLYYARGSLHETQTFIKLAYSRNLISNEDYQHLSGDLELLEKKLNAFIKSIDRNANYPKKP